MNLGPDDFCPPPLCRGITLASFHLLGNLEAAIDMFTRCAIGAAIASGAIFKEYCQCLHVQRIYYC